ncbi:MAG: hypothetical protein LBK99_17000, partial [Opitutaceae bacterium]|nr:hypothetical protein [Opitutaceae bacterium]
MKKILPEVIAALDAHIDAALRRQITDPGHPQTGGLLPPPHVRSQMPLDLADQGATARLAVSCAWHYIASRRAVANLAPRPGLLPRAIAAMDFLLRSRRESGLIDLQNCNHDSAPDTAFAVQQLVSVLSVPDDEWRREDPAWDALRDRIETFARQAVNGLATGGFHTPNHRWVISSALALTLRFVPGLDAAAAANAAATINAFLAETIDIDAEGAFIERSVGIYDAVCDLSLLFLEQLWPSANAAGAGQAAAANLRFNLHLLDSDGTAETGLSRRQDYGTRTIPLKLAACYLLATRLDNALVSDDDKTQFAQTARFLWDRASKTRHLPESETLNW